MGVLSLCRGFLGVYYFRSYLTYAYLGPRPNRACVTWRLQSNSLRGHALVWFLVMALTAAI